MRLSLNKNIILHSVKLIPKVAKLHSRKRLNLLFRIKILKLNSLSLNHIPKIMIFNFYMFRPVMKRWIDFTQLWLSYIIMVGSTSWPNKLASNLWSRTASFSVIHAAIYSAPVVHWATQICFLSHQQIIVEATLKQQIVLFCQAHTLPNLNQRSLLKLAQQHMIILIHIQLCHTGIIECDLLQLDVTFLVHT